MVHTLLRQPLTEGKVVLFEALVPLSIDTQKNLFFSQPQIQLPHTEFVHFKQLINQLHYYTKEPYQHPDLKTNYIQMLLALYSKNTNAKQVLSAKIQTFLQ